MQYTELYMLTISTVFGIILGIFFTVILIQKFKIIDNQNYKHKRQKKIIQKPKKKAKKVINHIKNNNKTFIKTDTKDKKIKENLIKKRVMNKKPSWTDFNCDIDEVDVHDYIENSRKKENKAYKFAKYQKEEN